MFSRSFIAPNVELDIGGVGLTAGSTKRRAAFSRVLRSSSVLSTGSRAVAVQSSERQITLPGLAGNNAIVSQDGELVTFGGDRVQFGTMRAARTAAFTKLAGGRRIAFG